MLGYTPLEVRTYGVLTLCTAMIILVNQLEQPYARSLIRCDKPQDSEQTEFSGSSRCASRLHVIGEGAVLWGFGDSLENVGRFLITLFVSGFADRKGRRAAAVVGWGFIVASTLLFQLAGIVESWAGTFFVIAQGLQGMSGIGLIAEIVVGDIVLAMKDTVSVMARRDRIFMGFGTVFFLGALYLQSMEITDFRPMWAVINATNIGILVTLAVWFPETRTEEAMKKAAEAESVSLFRMMIDEIGSYKKLIVSSFFIRCVLIDRVLSVMADGIGQVTTPLTMAFFGFSQFWAMAIVFPIWILSLVFLSLVPMLCKKLGHRRAWQLSWGYERFSYIFSLPLCPFMCSAVGLPWWVVTALLRVPTAGLGSLQGSVNLAIIGQESNAKFAAINQITEFLVRPFSTNLYTHTFDAKAATFLEKLRPFAFSNFFHVLLTVSVLTRGYPLIMEQCDKLTAEDAAKASESEGDGGDKKTD